MTIKELKMKLKRLKPLRFYIGRENTAVYDTYKAQHEIKLTVYGTKIWGTEGVFRWAKTFFSF